VRTKIEASTHACYLFAPHYWREATLMASTSDGEIPGGGKGRYTERVFPKPKGWSEVA
jgi:hypothetical protein